MFSNSFLTASDKNRWNFKSSRISNSSHAIDELHPRYTGRRCSSFLLILSIRMSGIWLLEISRGHAMSIDIKKTTNCNFSCLTSLTTGAIYPMNVISYLLRKTYISVFQELFP